jgi:hypothetical protein
MDPTRWPLAPHSPPSHCKSLWFAWMTTKARADEGHRRDTHCGDAAIRLRLREAGLDRADAGDGRRDGAWETVGSSTLQFELNQQGPNVTGYLRLTRFASTPGSGPSVGSVAGDTFRFRQVNGSGEGEMTVSGDDMTGQIRGYPFLTQVTLGRVNPSSKSASPPR